MGMIFLLSRSVEVAWILHIRLPTGGKYMKLKYQPIPKKPDLITVHYDHSLREITGKYKETCYLSATKQPFLFLLQALLTTYPKIETNYPPGKLGIYINGEAPTVDTIMKSGDSLLLCAT
jgi:hypothetical protein